MCQNGALTQLSSLQPWDVGDELQVQLQPGLLLILGTLTPLGCNNLTSWRGPARMCSPSEQGQVSGQVKHSPWFASLGKTKF